MTSHFHIAHYRDSKRLCRKYAAGYHAKYKGKLRRNFLSIYGASDEKKSCKEIFTPLNKKSKFHEIKLEMRNSFGFTGKRFGEIAKRPF